MLTKLVSVMITTQDKRGNSKNRAFMPRCQCLEAKNHEGGVPSRPAYTPHLFSLKFDQVGGVG